MSNSRLSLSTVMQTVISSIIFFGTIALVVLLVLNKQKPDQGDVVRKAPLVELIEIGSFDEKVKINLTGVVVPHREITIAAEVSGVITFKSENCKEGRYIDIGDESAKVASLAVRGKSRQQIGKQGPGEQQDGDEELDPRHLLSIDSQRYELARERLIAEVAEAKARQNRASAELAAAKTILDLTKKDLELQQKERNRMDGLFQSNVISEAEWNKSQLTYNAAVNAVTTQASKVVTLEADEKAQASLVELKKVQLREAEIDLKKAKIIAPATGVVISDDVQKDDFVQVGQKLLVFEDTSSAEVKCDLRADQLQAILDAQPDTLNPRDRFKLPSLPAKIEYTSNGRVYQWSGKLDRYDGLGLDERTRTAPCRIEVPETLSKDGKRTLVRGMYVSIELSRPPQEGLLAIPADALRAGNEIWVCKPIEQVLEELQRDNGGQVPEETMTEINSATAALQGNEVLGQLNKVTVSVTNRMSDKSGDEWVIAQADGTDFLEGTWLVQTPIPQPIDKDWLRYAPGAVKKAEFRLPKDGEQGFEAMSTSGQADSSLERQRAVRQDVNVRQSQEVIR